jgi:hypothetical protein
MRQLAWRDAPFDSSGYVSSLVLAIAKSRERTKRLLGYDQVPAREQGDRQAGLDSLVLPAAGLPMESWLVNA